MTIADFRVRAWFYKGRHRITDDEAWIMELLAQKPAYPADEPPDEAVLGRILDRAHMLELADALGEMGGPAMLPAPSRAALPLHPAIVESLEAAGFGGHEYTEDIAASAYTAAEVAEVQAMILRRNYS